MARIAAARSAPPAPSPPPPFWTKLTHRQPVVVFAHGVGAPSSSDWMTHWKEMVKDALDAIEVVTFDYSYMSGGKRRPPPKADKLVDHHLSVVKNAVAEHPGHPLVLMRKVSCMVASSDGISASAVICLGYPLKGAKRVMRDEILLKLMVPTMFVHFTSPCDSNESNTHIVMGSDHVLLVREVLVNGQTFRSDAFYKSLCHLIDVANTCYSEMLQISTLLYECFHYS
ncbi:hypothetical protein ZWY2020_027406 [Hordeum vulgare]|nr:hypothetical protein ZWY2020_027406 [Hordeum vulgare]